MRRWRDTTLLLAACLALSAPVQTSGAKVTWTDEQKFTWDLIDGGVIRNGSNYAFIESHRLQVNSVKVLDSASGKSASGKALQISYLGKSVRGPQGEMLRVARQVRLMNPHGVMRYVEMIENLTNSNLTVRVEVGVRIGTSTTGILGSDGQGLTIKAGDKYTLPANRSGIVLKQRSPRPTVLLFAATPKSTTRPVIINESPSSQQFSIRYDLKIKARTTAYVIHGVAQRRSDRINNQSINAVFGTFHSKAFSEGLVASTLANAPNYNPESAKQAMLTEPPTQAMELAKKHGTALGENAVLVADEDNRLLGKLSGESITIVSQFGKATIPLSEIAAIRGGANGPAQLILHNGEVLSGTATGTLTFESGAGLKTTTKVDEIVAAFLPRSSKPVARPEGLLKLPGGVVLSVSRPKTTFEAATAWGAVSIPADQVISLSRKKDPQPMTLCRLKDGSLLNVILRGATIDLVSARFGKVQVAIAGLRELRFGGEFPIAEQYCEMAGGNRFAGEFGAKEITIETKVGESAVATETISSMEPSEDAGILKIITVEGNALLGKIANVPWKSLGKTWNLPAHQIVRLVGIASKTSGGSSSQLEGLDRIRKVLETAKAKPPQTYTTKFSIPIYQPSTTRSGWVITPPRPAGTIHGSTAYSSFPSYRITGTRTIGSGRYMPSFGSTGLVKLPSGSSTPMPLPKSPFPDERPEAFVRPPQAHKHVW